MPFDGQLFPCSLQLGVVHLFCTLMAHHSAQAVEVCLVGITHEVDANTGRGEPVATKASHGVPLNERFPALQVNYAVRRPRPCPGRGVDRVR